MKKRILSLLCLAALLLALFAPWTVAAEPFEDVYLLGVNDTVMLGFINAGQMPVMRVGAIYAPCTLLDNKDLGLSYAVDRNGGTFTIYTKEQSLIFRLNRSGASDGEGNAYSQRIISRNGVVFFPLRFVAEFFGLRYSYYNLVLPEGTVPISRVCTSQASLSDAQFGTSAAQLVAGPLRQYVESQAAPSPSPSAPGPTPTPSVPPDAQATPVTVSLAVACTDGAGFQTLLDAFASARYSALFLFSPADLLERDGDVRAAAAAGHQIGLLLGPDTPEEDFRLGNARLGHILRAETNQVAFLSGGSREGNWRLWSGNISIRGRGSTQQAANLAEDVRTAQGAARVTLNDSRTTALALQRSIRTWTQRPYTLATVTEAG